MEHPAIQMMRLCLSLVAVALLVHLSVSPVGAHTCGPLTLELRVGEMKTYTITGAMTVSYQVTGKGDAKIATISPDTPFSAADGIFTVTGVGPGDTSFSITLNTPMGIEVCGFSVTVTGSAAPTRNGPGMINLTGEPNRGCGCGPDSPHNGGSTVASAKPLFSTCPPGVGQDAGPHSVYLHSGEFYDYEVDLEIPGRGFNWKFERKYRNGITYNGPLGYNWEFNYNRRLFLETGVGILRMDGFGRVDRYRLVMGRYLTPAGFYTQLTQNSDGSFIERDRSGNKVLYSPFDPQGVSRMTEIRDRNGNRMRFQYNPQGQLIRVLDTLGRPIDYSYNPQGLLIEVRDFSGRSIKFAYDQNENLTAVTSPVVAGTPTRNDFPQGKTTRYTYSSGLSAPVLNHNLLTITYPNETASGAGTRVRVEYETALNSPNVDRVTRQTVGGTNAPAEFAQGQVRFRQDLRVPAGGTISYEYRSVGSAPDNDFRTEVTQTTATDRNGDRTLYFFNRIGNIVRTQEFTNRDLRPTDPEFFETRYEYNSDGEMLRENHPEGNSVEYLYDSGNADRFQQGNLLAEIRRPDPKRGGDQAAIRTNYTYEPVYQQLRTVTEARGNDPTYVPQNGGASSSARYTTVHTFDYQEGQNFVALATELGTSQNAVRSLLTLAAIPTGLPDTNGDGVTNQIGGNVIRLERPAVTLLAGSNMARIEGGTRQPIAEIASYNQFGQVLRKIDPEGNVDQREYYPENDPDGDGRDLTSGVGTGALGYLKQLTRDAVSAAGRDSGANPAPANLRNVYQYDRVGNVIREVDGRGIATQYAFNALNKVVQISRAAASNVFAPEPVEPLALTNFQYLERIFYDFNGNIVRRQVEDRGNTSGVGGDNADGGTAFVDYEYRYDILDNQIEKREEVSDSEDLVTRFRYDRNENIVLVIQPEGNAVASVYDERDLIFQRTRGATSPPSMVHLGTGDPMNFNPRGGQSSTETYHYDLNRNLLEAVDADDTDESPSNGSRLGGNGDRTRYIYDAFDRPSGMVDSAGNQTVLQYDPAGNVVRVCRFGPAGGPSPNSDGPDALSRPVSSGGVIQPANLVSSSLLESTEGRYDELNRLIQGDPALFLNTIPTMRPPDLADGATDIGKGNLTPGDNQPIPGVSGVTILGRVTTRAEYDRNSRRTFIVQDDTDTFATAYDGAGRVIRRLDPEGNTIETAYDDDNNVIETRETDVSQVAGVTSEIFLTTYFYDSLNRLLRQVDNLGQTIDYRYDSRNNLAAMADAQGPSGQPVTRRAFMGGTLTNNTSNSFGNATLYAYDGINRKVREDVVLTATGRGDGMNIGADLFGVKTTAPTPDRTQAGSDGLITTRNDWDGNSLLTSLTDDNGNQTQYTYDNLNRRLTETRGECVPPRLAGRCDPPTTIAFEYDPDDNTIRTRDENGSLTEYGFDALNRLTEIKVTRGTGVVGTTAATYEYDGLSRLTRGTDNNEPAVASDDSVITFAYDSLGRLIEETQQIGSSPVKAISSKWRADRLRSGLTYPNGRGLASTFDRLDRLNTLADAGAAQPIADYDYLGQSRVLQRRYPINGTRLTFLNDTRTTDVGYDGLRRPTQLRHLRSDNSLVAGFSHTYDRMNNKRIEEKLHATRESELYRYDSDYRLTQFSRGTLNSAKDAITAPSGNAPLHGAWTLDGVGNWSRVDNETRQHSSFNEITQRGSTPILSDDNGNLTDDGRLILTWDFRNRLRAATRKTDGATVAVYSYDAVGRRVRKVVTNSGPLNGPTDFYLDRWQAIEERDARDAVVQQYVYGIYIDEPLILDRNLDGDSSATGSADQRLFYHQNTLYSVLALTDGTGRTVEGYQYDAYGRQTVFAPGGNGVVDFGGDDLVSAGGMSLVGSPNFFTGQRFDAETRIYYYKNRYYSPESGRFISRDPLENAELLGGGGGLYTYAYNNPIMHVDPSGEFVPWLAAAWGLVKVGAVGSAVGAGISALVSWVRGESTEVIKSRAVGGAVAGGLIGMGLPVAAGGAEAFAMGIVATQAGNMAELEALKAITGKHQPWNPNQDLFDVTVGGVFGAASRGLKVSGIPLRKAEMECAEAGVGLIEETIQKNVPVPGPGLRSGSASNIGGN